MDLRRLPPFGDNYWHVVSDKHASIIGSLLFTPGATYPWRAEFNGTMADGWKTFKVEYFPTEELAMKFLREMMEDEEAKSE